MQLFPAIDLRGGKVVRLTQGDYDRMTVYGEDPCAQARAFLEAGAKNLHVVDLDGAKDGTLSNYDTIAALAKQGGLYIEVGGGIRTEERIEKYLSLGVGRCILGSVAVTNFDFTARMLKKYGDKIAVGVDARDGYSHSPVYRQPARSPCRCSGTCPPCIAPLHMPSFKKSVYLCLYPTKMTGARQASCAFASWLFTYFKPGLRCAILKASYRAPPFRRGGEGGRRQEGSKT